MAEKVASMRVVLLSFDEWKQVLELVRDKIDEQKSCPGGEPDGDLVVIEERLKFAHTVSINVGTTVI